MINIAKYDGLDVYSFQRDHNLQELPENITDLQHLLISWEDTLAALSLMDIVITSCTSIAHAAAAMGKETWVFTPVLPYHIWAFGAPESKTSPYYKTAQVYRQKDNRNWNETFQEMYADLEKKFELEHIDLPNCDKVYKKANLGCGFEKLKGFDNYDISPVCRPDKILDLNVEKWDIPDDEYDHIVAKDVLEHVDDLIHVIKEMYRISSHGAVWEVQVPHWRCDNFIDDPTHKNAISARTFELFDMKKTLENLQRKLSHSYYAIEYNIDIEVCEVKYDFTDVWMRRFTESNASQAEIDYALNHMNNVAESIKILIQVHKGPRYNQADIEKVINEYCENF
jgi:SAM-dependent methyltransferase